MQLVFGCPSCQKPVSIAVSNSTEIVRCYHCNWSKIVDASDIENDSPQTCMICGCGDLWRQKDFPPQLGLTVVVIGALGAMIAWAFYWPITAIGILMAVAVFDLLLYSLMKDVLVCYRCASRHRHANLDESHPRFNLELAERYRQEAKRLEESSKQ